MRINCAYKELRDIINLVPHDKNSNRHPEKQIKMLAKILSFQGWRHPIVVSTLSGKVVAGHGRLEAAKLNGWSQVPIDIQEFKDEAEEILFLTSDNKIAELADHDDAMMLENIKELELSGDFDFELFGLDDFKLPNFEPVDFDEQGKLDETKVVIMECPHCAKSFEKSQAKIID